MVLSRASSPASISGHIHLWYLGGKTGKVSRLQFVSERRTAGRRYAADTGRYGAKISPGKSNATTRNDALGFLHIDNRVSIGKTEEMLSMLFNVADE